jgi:quercetin dioxygenase-like cupin family protein
MGLEGKGEIKIDGKPNVVESGQLIIMPKNIPHAVYAVERFKMMLIMIRSKE